MCLDEHTTKFFIDFTNSASSNMFWRTERIIKEQQKFCGKDVLSPLCIKGQILGFLWSTYKGDGSLKEQSRGTGKKLRTGLNMQV